MKWINAKQETPRPDAYLMVLLSDYENTYYYTDLKGWDEIEDIDDEYGIAWSELPKHPYQDSTGWNVITDTPFAELDFEDEALVFIKHDEGGHMAICCPHDANEVKECGEITHWMKIPVIPSYATPSQAYYWKMASQDNDGSYWQGIAVARSEEELFWEIDAHICAESVAICPIARATLSWRGIAHGDSFGQKIEKGEIDIEEVDSHSEDGGYTCIGNYQEWYRFEGYELIPCEESFADEVLKESK